MRDSLYHTLTRQYSDQVRLYQEAQETFKRHMMNKIHRQVQFVKPDVTTEQVKSILTSTGGRDEFYRQVVLHGSVSPQVK